MKEYIVLSNKTVSGKVYPVHHGTYKDHAYAHTVASRVNGWVKEKATKEIQG